MPHKPRMRRFCALFAVSMAIHATAQANWLDDRAKIQDARAVRSGVGHEIGRQAIEGIVSNYLSSAAGQTQITATAQRALRSIPADVLADNWPWLAALLIAGGGGAGLNAKIKQRLARE